MDAASENSGDQTEMQRCVRIPLRLMVFVWGLEVFLASGLMAQSFKVLYTADGTNGAWPQGLIVSKTALYGTAQRGGSTGNGTVFKLNKDGTAFEVLHHFTGATNDGALPFAGLVLSGNTLYGTAYGGGYGFGTVFAMSTDGTGFTNLHSFGGSDGANPQADLVLVSNRLYGTTSFGGVESRGTVFALNTDGTAFTSLHSFAAAESSGYWTVPGVVVSGSMLYGTTTLGSTAASLFAMNTDGTGYTNLHSFDGGTGGGPPFSRLTLLGNTLYGTAANGGISRSGAIFAVNTDGTKFKVVLSFDPMDQMPLSPPYYLVNRSGAYPTYLVSSGNKLYGTASTGGGWGIGTVFGLNTDGTGFQVLYTFDDFIWPISPVGPWTNNVDGGAPNGLILSDNILYGTAQQYGVNGYGTIFSISLPLPQLATTRSGRNLLLSWRADFSGFTLQSATNLSSPVWTPDLPAPVVVNGQYTVTNPISRTQQFFRLGQ